MVVDSYDFRIILFMEKGLFRGDIKWVQVKEGYIMHVVEQEKGGISGELPPLHSLDMLGWNFSSPPMMYRHAHSTRIVGFHLKIREYRRIDRNDVEGSEFMTGNSTQPRTK